MGWRVRINVLVNVSAGLIASNNIALLFDFVAFHQKVWFGLLFYNVAASLVASHSVASLIDLIVFISVSDVDDNLYRNGYGCCGRYKNDNQCDDSSFRHKKSLIIYQYEFWKPKDKLEPNNGIIGLLSAQFATLPNEASVCGRRAEKVKRRRRDGWNGAGAQRRC